MFDWLFGNGRADLNEARDMYWNESSDSAKERYDAIREASWADPDQWERNLQREEGRDD